MSKNIDKTLAEQLTIDEREIAYRKSLIDFQHYEIKYLLAAKPYIERVIDNIVASFYAKQVENSEIALLIGDSETLSRLKGAMRRYILELFSGKYDADYVNQRLRIGKVHKRIGVSPKLYISAIWLLEQTLVKAITEAEEFDIKTLDKEKIKLSLNKLIMLDTQFVFDTYISSLVNEVETAKEELQTYANSLEEIISSRTKEIEQLSRQDALTGLQNQKTFYEFLKRELQSSERHQEVLSIIYFDLNNFKNINDTLGHQEGDKVLAVIGSSILASIRDIDIPCRYGGDEFGIILPRTKIDQAIEVSNRIIQNFQQHEQYRSVTFSIGIASNDPTTHTKAEDFFKEVDKLMYQSKSKSKIENDFIITTPNIDKLTPEKQNISSLPQVK